MAPSVDLAGGLAVGDSLTNWSLGGWLQVPPALVFGRGVAVLPWSLSPDLPVQVFPVLDACSLIL